MLVGYQTTYINDKEYTPLWRGAGTSPTLGFFIKDMKELKCITIYPEVYHNDNLTPNEKIYLSVVRYYTVRGKKHLCGFSDKVMSEELLIGVRQIQNIKSKLKKLGLIIITEKGIKYVSQNNDNKPLNNDTMSQNNDNKPLNNDNKPLNNDTMSQNNDNKPLNNDTMSQNNDTNPCNTDDNQQVTKENKENKEYKAKIKNNKEENKENNLVDDDFLSSWSENALREKEENYKREKEEKEKNYCSVVDMVTSLPVKEETPNKEEALNETVIEDRNTLLSVIAKKMVDKISYNIKIQAENIKQECDRKVFLQNNEFNEFQLNKFIKEYIKDRDLNKIIQDQTVLNNFTINAFNSYRKKIVSEARKTLKGKNPYSDLEDSNSYKETNRWMK